MLEKSCDNPKEFWNKWKNCTDHFVTNLDSKISGGTWFNHFSTLHSTDEGDITKPVTNTQLKSPDVDLNRPFTLTELTEEINKMKNNKSVGYDRISNEMIKSSPLNVKVMLLNFINLCQKKSLAPATLCNEIITPIHKSGLVDDPDNYRGICVSSSLTKLFTSMISTRLQKKVDEEGLISKNQIGFRKRYRTADHLLTLQAKIRTW